MNAHLTANDLSCLHNTCTSLTNLPYWSLIFL